MLLQEERDIDCMYRGDFVVLSIEGTFVVLFIEGTFVVLSI
jgi:hypothetical protein